MHELSQLSDEIKFEVPSYAPARRFAVLLGLEWATSVEDLVGDSTLIIVALGTEPTSFARLLRLVEVWVRDEALGAIRFGVDGRDYLLQAGECDWRLDAKAVL